MVNRSCATTIPTSSFSAASRWTTWPLLRTSRSGSTAPSWATCWPAWEPRVSSWPSPTSDVYTALERGVLDAGVTGGEPGHSQRWYEVTDYLYGPIIGSVAVAYFTMSSDSWSQLPPDIQQITLDVGKEHEKLARKTLIEEWNVFSVEANVEAGMIHRPFSDEVQNKMREVALNVILPNWVERTGGPNSEAAQLYNDKVAPILGVAINPDGSAKELVAAMMSEPRWKPRARVSSSSWCINRNVAACELVDSFFVPEVAKRTDGQVQFNLSSFPELGIAGADTLRLVADNTLEVAEVYSGYVGGGPPVAGRGQPLGPVAQRGGSPGADRRH